MSKQLLTNLCMAVSQLGAMPINFAAAANRCVATASSTYQLDFRTLGRAHSPYVFEVAFAGASCIETINIFNVSFLNGSNVGLWKNDFFTAGDFANLLLSIPNLNFIGTKVRVSFLPGTRDPGEDYLHFDEIQAVGNLPEPRTWMLSAAGFAQSRFSQPRAFPFGDSDRQMQTGLKALF